MNWFSGEMLYYAPSKAAAVYYEATPSLEEEASNPNQTNCTAVRVMDDVPLYCNTNTTNTNTITNNNSWREPEAVADHDDVAGCSPASYASLFLLMHSLAMVVAIALVSELFAQAHTTALTVPTYMLAPADAACQAWIDGDCVEELEDLQWGALRGVAQLSEHKTRGLMAEVNPAVLCLVVQTALAACFTPMFRRVRATVLLSMGVLLLFQQVRWQLSFGGLLWCELMLMVTFFLTGTRHGYGAVEAHRLLGMPMLMVATLAVAGENDASALAVVHLSLSAMLLSWTVYARVDETQRTAVAVNACLAFVPFVLRVGLRLDAMTRLPVAAPAWTLAALVFALVWMVLFVATHSLMPFLPHSAQVVLFFVDQMAHTVLVLLVILGLLGSA